jgi:hypothetical protein
MTTSTKTTDITLARENDGVNDSYRFQSVAGSPVVVLTHVYGDYKPTVLDLEVASARALFTALRNHGWQNVPSVGAPGAPAVVAPVGMLASELGLKAGTWPTYIDIEGERYACVRAFYTGVGMDMDLGGYTYRHLASGLVIEVFND